ncbi:MAG TPA: hypothetical protein VJ945_06530 [Flavobacteriaceae bacterium]|nr:hypothetical protein [Flavobacteriaceae bacterium]
MNKKIQEQPDSEEVDLGQLFKLIGNAFNRFFRFIGSILNGLFLAFVWLVFFFKRHAIKIVIAAVLGFGFGFLKEKISRPIYQSSVIVKQNYDTGKNLYGLIDYYNQLIKDKDTLTLKLMLGTPTQLASSIKSIEIKPTISETQLIKNYDNYIKGLDSTLAATIDYETYYENIDLWEFGEQEISIKSKERTNLSSVFDKIVENINKSEYFKRENEKDINQLNNREAALRQVLTKGDSLQNVYKRVLEMPLDQASGSQTSITIEGSDQIDKTKEFELYKSEIEIRRELVQIEREREDKEQILEIVTNKQDTAILNNNVVIFNREFSQKLFYTLAFALITILILLGLNFIKFLERYKDKL